MSTSKRVHISLGVTDLDANVTFYSSLFGQPPTILKPDYAKWQLEDPKLNFCVDVRGDELGVDHLGIEFDSTVEVTATLERYRRDGIDVQGEGQIICGYHRSDKGWIADPQAVLWETFFSSEVTTHYGAANEDVTAGSEARSEAVGASTEK